VRLTLKKFALLSFAALAALFAPQGALADPFPPGAQAQNVQQIGFSALGGRYGGFKIAIKHTADNKWYLYTGLSFNQGWSIVDVTRRIRTSATKADASARTIPARKSTIRRSNSRAS
jgi:hypothetical protein